MHQQVRTTTTTSGSDRDGPGAMAARGGLTDILRTLSDEGFNLQAAGGHDLGRGGEFVFAVRHPDGDDDEAEKAAELLREHGYRNVRVVNVFHRHVDDTPGALLRCVEDAEAEQGPADEIFVGTPDEQGHIPVQVTSRGR